MILVGAAEDYRVSASTANVINISVDGLTRVGGISSLGGLYGPVQLPSTSVITMVPTAASSERVIKDIRGYNTSGSIVTVKFYKSGSAGLNQEVSIDVPANGSFGYFDGKGWCVFNSAGIQITTSSVVLTGDVSGSGSGAITTTLATVNSNTGAIGDASHSLSLNLDAKGRALSATTNAIQITESQVTSLTSDLSARELLTNKATDFTSVNNTLYPTVQAVNNAIATAVTGLLDYRGSYDASTNLFPATGGSGVAGAVLKADFWICSIAGTLGGTAVSPGDQIVALVDTPAQTAGNWDIIEHDLGYVPENAANKSNTTTLGTSTTLYPTQNAAKVYSDNKVENSITSGHTTIAPSGDAVFTALAGKQPLDSDLTAIAGLTPTTSDFLQFKAGAWSNRTPTQVTADLDVASSSLKGLMSIADKKKLVGYIYDVVNDYGGDQTGVADSTTAINNAVAAAQSAGYIGGSGGNLWYEAGRYKTSSTIPVTGHNIGFSGPGAGSSLDFGNYYVAMAAAIVPNGAFVAVKVSPVQTNGLNGVPNNGFKWKGMAVDCYASNATMGLQLISCVNFDIDDYYVINPTNTGLDFNTLPAAALTIAAAFPLSAATLTVGSTLASGTGDAFATSGSVVLRDGTGTPRLLTYTGKSNTTFTGVSSGGLGSGSAPIGGAVQILPGAQDCTRGRVGQITIRTIESGGIGIQMNGDLGGFANTNIINFVGPVKISHFNGIGIKDVNSDTNYFDHLTINRAAGGTAAGAEIGAGAANTFASRNNVFNHVSFGAGGLICRGTPTAAFPSGPTIVMNYQLANGEALPTVEAGAILDVRNFNGCFRVGNLTAPAITTQALTAATVNQINNTKIPVPPQGFQVGTHLVFYVPMIKTAVGTSWLYNLRYGTGAVATGAILQTVTYTATAAIDGGILEVHCIITALGTGTSATNTGYAILRHDLAATGLASGVTAPVSDATAPAGFIYTRPTFAGFDSTLPASGTPQFLSIEINPVTALTVQTIQPGAQAFCLAQSNF